MANDLDTSAESAADSFLSVSGEDVVYTKRSGAVRTVRAIVERNVPVEMGTTGFTMGNVTIDVKPAATGTVYNGILPTEVQAGDHVTVVRVQGKAAESMTITGDPISGDAGLIRFLLR